MNMWSVSIEGIYSGKSDCSVSPKRLAVYWNQMFVKLWYDKLRKKDPPSYQGAIGDCSVARILNFGCLSK